MSIDRNARRMTILAGILLIAGAVAFFVDQRGREQGGPQGPSGTRVEFRTPDGTAPQGASPDGSATRDAADLPELRESVNALAGTLSRERLDGNHWQQAERQAEEILQRWVSFKTPMRAGAGDRMWSTSDVNRFDAAVKEARTQVSDRNLAAAREAVDEMQNLIEKYDSARRGPSQAAARD